MHNLTMLNFSKSSKIIKFQEFKECRKDTEPTLRETPTTPPGALIALHVSI